MVSEWYQKPTADAAALLSNERSFYTLTAPRVREVASSLIATLTGYRACPGVSLCGEADEGGGVAPSIAGCTMSFSRLRDNPHSCLATSRRIKVPRGAQNPQEESHGLCGTIFGLECVQHEERDEQ